MPSFGDSQVRELDLDSHADLAVLGANSYVFEDKGRTVDVFTYDPKLGSSTRKVVSGCFAYDDPNSEQCILLVVHQGFGILSDPSLPDVGE
jgi:hypothetical protein